MGLTLADIALVSERNYRFGGAQRLLAILADLFDKPIYLPLESSDHLSERRPFIWSKPAVCGVPAEPVMLTGLVKSPSEFHYFTGKINVKVCHSIGSIEGCWKCGEAKQAYFLTYRSRVRDYYNDKGLRMWFVPNGIIPYDGSVYRSCYGPKDSDLISVNARLEPLKTPLTLFDFLAKLPYKIQIFGSIQNERFVNQIADKVTASSNMVLVANDLSEGVSQDLKNQLLQKSCISVHFSDGGYRDCLEYSIIDAWASGNIPICITADPVQFEEISKRKLGIIANSIEHLPLAIEAAFKKREELVDGISTFMAEFVASQRMLQERWVDCIISNVAQL